MRITYLSSLRAGSHPFGASRGLTAASTLTSASDCASRAFSSESHSALHARTTNEKPGPLRFGSAGLVAESVVCAAREEIATGMRHRQKAATPTTPTQPRAPPRHLADPGSAANGLARICISGTGLEALRRAVDEDVDATDFVRDAGEEHFKVIEARKVGAGRRAPRPRVRSRETRKG